MRACIDRHVPRFRFIRSPPDLLEYRNGRIFLRDQEGMYDAWNWVARKDIETYHAVVLLKARSADELATKRTAGFDLETVTPASLKIMQSLVALGYAEAID